MPFFLLFFCKSNNRKKLFLTFKFLDRNDLKIKACLGIKLEDRAQLPRSGCVSDQVYIEIEVYKVCPFVLTI